MGYGMYGSGSYSTFGSYSSRSSMRSSSYSPQTSTSRTYASQVSGSRTSSTAQNTGQQTSSQKTVQQTAGQEATVQQNSAQKTSEQKSSGKKTSFRNSPVPDRLAVQKNGANKSSDQKTSSPSKSAMKKGSKQKAQTQKVSEQKTSTQKSAETKTSVQKTSSTKKSSEQVASVQKTSTKQVSMQQNTIQALADEEVETIEETKGATGLIIYTEGTLVAKKEKAAVTVDTVTEKTADELKLEKEEQRKVIKKKDLHDMELQVTKHPKFLALQDKLNSRLSKRQDKKIHSESKTKAPTGYVTYGLVTIKNITSFLELSLSNEEATLDTLEDIHDLLDKEFVSHKVYKVEAEIGKFLLASKSVDEMINLSMKIQIKFNEHTWNDKILALPMFRKLLRPEDLLNDEAIPLFNGPRLSIGVHSGEASTEEDSTGHSRYRGVNIVQVETIGKFAQGGQILISSNAWTKVNTSKLSKHMMNRLGVFKLEDFNAGCSIVEITPEILQERAKFYGAVCSHCAKGIQPWEKSFEKLQCTWHEDHFKCFNCGELVEEGTYAAYQGLPHCHSCYLNANPKPKCKKCINTIAKDYIIALGAYWHANCFACKQCRKRPSPGSNLCGYKDDPYCQVCYDKLLTVTVH